MATSENDLTSIKCWLKLHSHLKEGDKIEDKRAKCHRLAWLPRNATPQAPVLGLPEGSGLRAAGCGRLASRFWRELELGHLNRGKGWLALVNHKNFKNDGTLRKGGKLPEATLTCYHHL